MSSDGGIAANTSPVTAVNHDEDFANDPVSRASASPVPHRALDTGTSDGVEEVLLPGEPVPDASHFASVSTDAEQEQRSSLTRALTSNKRTLSSRVTPAEISTDAPRQRDNSYSVVDIMQNLDHLNSGDERASVTSSMKRGDQSPHRQWINGIWYAAQEVERRKEQQASEMFEEKRKADSLRDVGAVVDEVRKHGIEAQETSATRTLFKRLSAFRDTAAMHAIDAACSLFLIFVLDIYAISSSSSIGDDIVQALMLAALCVLALFFLFECFFNHDRSALPYTLLEFLSVISFIPGVVWWLESFHVRTADDLWSVKVLTGCSRAGKIIRLAVTFPRIFLWRIDRRAKTQEAHFAAHTVRAHEKRLSSTDSHRLEAHDSLRSLGRLGSHVSMDSSEGKSDGNQGKHRSHISIIMNRQMVHHSVLMVCCFYGMLAGYEVLSYTNDIKDVESIMKMLQKVHFQEGNSTLFGEVSKPVFDRLDEKGLKAVYLQLNGEYVFGDNTAIDSLRTSPPVAAEYILPKDTGSGICEVHFDMSKLMRADIGKSLYLSFMSIFVIFGTTAMMHKTLLTDVIRPMERMIAVIAQLAQEPLAPVKKTPKIKELSSTFETKMVEMAIYKFASLLQLAFGEAGANIIRDNSSGGVLNQNMTGKVVQGIFGFCDVRNFTTLTEILQGDVVKIVNGIADVVHGAVVDNYGAPNKNVGDAFLLVWKPKGEQKVSHVAESALRSYIRTILHMAQSELLSGYCAEEDVRRELHRRMPDLRLRLGFGLHYGWAVECAIGSSKKIDASYLSPHVNLASRLEAGTKQYGVDILISAQVFSLFGAEVQELCRLVDRVTFKGSDQPICIYTYDVPDPDDPTDVATSPLSRGMSFSSLNRVKGWEAHCKEGQPPARGWGKK